MAVVATQEDRQDLRHLDKPAALLPPQNSGRPFLPSPTGSRTCIQVRVSRRALSPCRVCPPRKSGRDVVGPSVSSASLLCLWCLPTHHHCVLDPTVLPASGLGPHGSVGSTDASAVYLSDSSPMCISSDFTIVSLPRPATASRHSLPITRWSDVHHCHVRTRSARRPYTT